MGKKRITTQADTKQKKGTIRKTSKKKLVSGILHVQASYNNTIVTLTDTKGNKAIATSSGALGFRGAKKGTPFAAAKVGEVLGEAAKNMGVKEVSVVVKGVGSGRESAIRSFVAGGINISSIKDVTPVAHNGPRARKPRRV